MELDQNTKKTDVGRLPPDWDARTLGELGEVLIGLTYRPSDVKPDGTLVLRSSNIQADALSFDNNVFVGVNVPEKIMVRTGDVLICVRNGSRDLIGKSALLDVRTKGMTFGAFMAVYRCHMGDFVSFLFQSEILKRQINEHLGATINQITNRSLNGFKIPVPPTDAEWRAIATALSDVDALIAGLERLIAKKRDIKQAAMQQLLTGQTRLPGFSGEWANKVLGDLAQFHKGKGLPKSALSAQGAEPCIHYGELFTQYSERIERIISSTDFGVGTFRSKSNDVLMPTSDVTPRGLAKASCVLQDNVILGGDILVIRTNPSETSGVFLSYVIRHNESQVLSLVTGSTVFHLYGSDMRRFEFKGPDSVAEQSAIAAVLSDMDADLTALESRLAKTRAIKQGMMQELLTGRTRLVDSVQQSHAQESEPTEERKANVYFMRSVLAAEIVDQLHQEPTFGHVKFEKMMFLTEHLCQVDTGSQYARKAAGPLDRKALHSIDSQLKKQKWFDVRKENGRYRYVPLEKHGGHKDYFNRYFAPISTQLSSIIETFRTWDTERCEIVATLYAAWNDLLRENDAVSDDMIVHEVLHNWHESKQRIPEDRWLKALSWMRENAYVPGRVAGTAND